MKVLFLAMLFVLFSGQSNAQSGIMYKVSKIEAALFYSDKATFSRNIIDNPDFALWNVIIGEGSAEGPSNQTLVKVFVHASGNGQSNAEALSLDVTVMNGRSIQKKRYRVGLFEKNRTNCYGILIDDTGCAPVTITAKLIGKGGGSEMKKRISFGCGE
jgi:hypothetical protein